MISASKSARVLNCPGSFALPQEEGGESEHAARGTIIHDFMEDCRKVGRDTALRRVEAIDGGAHLAACEVIDTDWLLGLEGRVLVEAGFSWNIATGEVKCHGEHKKHGDIPGGPGIITGIADLIVIATTAMVVIDYKTGRMVERAQDNPQLLTLAALAERALGVDLPVDGAILYLWDGLPYFDRASWDALDVDAHASALESAVVRISKADPTLHNGPWCRYCPAYAACPIKTGLMRAAASGQLLKDAMDDMVKGRPDIAVQALAELKGLVGHLTGQLQNYVEARGPIPMGDGRVWGPRFSKPREQLDGKAVFQMLKDSMGVDPALAAVSLETSKTALRHALRPVAKEKGVPLARLERDALDVLRKQGGITLTKPGCTYEVHNPKQKE